MKKNAIIFVVVALLSLALIPMQALAYGHEVQTAKVVKTVNFRDAASTSGDRIRYLQVGEVLEVLEKVNDYWLKLKDKNGQIGYVSSSQTYIELQTDIVEASPNAEIVGTVSFRTGPSTDYDRIRYLQPGELVYIINKVNDYWYYVSDTHNQVGYVSSGAKYIETTFGQSEEPEEAHFRDEPNATVISSVSFRTGPSTSYERIRYLKSGERIVILEKVNDYWYKAEDQHAVVGYVSTSSQYIETTYTEPYKLMDPAIAVQKIIEAGKIYIGTPYEFGSSRYDTLTFDCSDFVRQAFIDGIGMRLPGDSRSQGDFVKGVGKTTTNINQLQVGDLMFFMSYKGYSASDYENIDKSTQNITHVGIYIGNGQVLHTYSKDSGGVRIDNFAGRHWEYRFLFGGSAL